MIQENLNSYRREINSQREKIQKLTATSQKYEQIIHTMTQDLREAIEKLAVAEVCPERNKTAKYLSSLGCKDNVSNK